MQPANDARVSPYPDVLTRALRVGLGALVVALSAQLSIPLAFTPVPFTLQGLAVLLVGAWLGPAEGAAALGTYLLAGAAGAPVFAFAHGGLLHLLGPTGGYLLAFPAAAAVAGLARSRRLHGAARIAWTALVLTVAMAVIHLGGVSQLALLGGDPGLAFRAGLMPFLAGDLTKVAIATVVLAFSRSRLTTRH